MLAFLELYAPSVLTRYALQLMTVALPWVLQLQNQKMDSIASSFIFFYLGSLIAGGLALRYSDQLRVRDSLAITLFLQGVLSAACFFFTDPLTLATLRIAQGFILGLARPANQIFINEYRFEESKEVLKKRSIFGQVAITVGMILGSGLGSMIGLLFDWPKLSFFLIASACVLPGILVPILLKWNPYNRHHQTLKDERSLFQSLATPEVIAILVLYLVSLTVFKSWILLVPFELRAQSAEFGLNSAGAFLSALFLVHPILFALSQYVLGRLSHFLPQTNKSRILWMTISISAQALLPFLGLMTKNIWILGASVLAGGAVVAALIYPLLISVLYDVIPSPQGTLMRKIYVVLAITADLGQLIGAALLAPTNSYMTTGILPALCVATLVIGFLHLISLKGRPNYVGYS